MSRLMLDRDKEEIITKAGKKEEFAHELLSPEIKSAEQNGKTNTLMFLERSAGPCSVNTS